MNVTIISKSTCPLCREAINLCETQELNCKVINIEGEAAELTKLLKPEFVTVPQIYVNDRYIGGLSAFQEFVKFEIPE